MKANRERVSVIIPAYNVAKYVTQCLDSIKSDPAVGEIIVVDNASTDGTADIIRSHRDPRIRLIPSLENLGATKARHLGIGQARYDLLCFLDADDFLSEGAIGIAARRLASAKLDLCVFDMVRVDEAGENSTPHISPPADILDGTSAFLLTVGKWRIQPMGVLLKSLYQRATDHVLLHGFSDDELVSRRLFLAAQRVGGNEGVYYYRNVPKRVVAAQRISQAVTDVEVLRLAIERIPDAQGWPQVLRQRDLLLRRTFTYSARGLFHVGYGQHAKALLEEVPRLTQEWPPASLAARLMLSLGRMLIPLRRRK